MDRKLMNYLPLFMQTYEEIEQIMKVEQEQVEGLWDTLKGLFKETFVSDESEIGAKRWESILNITPLDTDTMQLRNFRIQSRLIEDIPFTYRTLRNQLEALCGKDGYETILDGDHFTLHVKVALTTKKLKKEVESICERVVPLNLFIDVVLMYNTHRMLKPFTYGQLKLITHKQIKDEPFE